VTLSVDLEIIDGSMQLAVPFRRIHFNHFISDEFVVLRLTAKKNLPTIRALLVGRLGYILRLKAECT